MTIEELWYPLIGVVVWIILAYWAAKGAKEEDYVIALVLVTVLSAFWFVLPIYLVIGVAGTGIYKIANRKSND